MPIRTPPNGRQIELLRKIADPPSGWCIPSSEGKTVYAPRNHGLASRSSGRALRHRSDHWSCPGFPGHGVMADQAAWQAA